MKHLIVVFLLLFLLPGCNNKEVEEDFQDEENVSNLKEEVIANRTIKKFPEIKHDTRIEALVNRIAAVNSVHERGIGAAGEYSEVYASFERINEIASKKELLDLLQHDSAAVRVYAFRCIESRDSSLADSARILIKHKEAPVEWFSGCIRMTVPLSFLIDKAEPDTLDKYIDTSGQKVIIRGWP